MPSFRVTRKVLHSAQNMFALVADVEAYPQFLPLCQGLRVRRRTAGAQGRDIIIADMDVGYKNIRETFGSRVTLDPSALKIVVEYIDGPFRRLENTWTFRDIGGQDNPSCQIEFFIDYEFKSRMLGLLMGSMFDTAFRKFAEAFEQRADAIYGRTFSALKS